MSKANGFNFLAAAAAVAETGAAAIVATTAASAAYCPPSRSAAPQQHWLGIEGVRLRVDRVNRGAEDAEHPGQHERTRQHDERRNVLLEARLRQHVTVSY